MQCRRGLGEMNTGVHHPGRRDHWTGESNIKMDRKEIIQGRKTAARILLFQHRDQWWALVNTIMIFCDI
jgi:hypothetical protein